MSPSNLLILATIFTIGGFVSVAWIARLILWMAPFKARLLAGILLLIYASLIFLRPASWLIIDIAVLVGAIGAAVILGGSLRSAGAVLTMLVTAAVVDILSVSGGLSRIIIDQYQEGTSDLILYLVLVLPIDSRLLPIVGISDLLLGGSAASALIRLGFKPIPVFGMIALGFLGALAYGIWQGGAPALPFIAAASFLLLWLNPVDSIG